MLPFFYYNVWPDEVPKITMKAAHGPNQVKWLFNTSAFALYLR
jgi:hypothetical protein